MPSSQYSPSAIEEAAKEVYKLMVVDCLAKGLQRLDHEYGSGFILEGHLAQYIRMVWPETNQRNGSGKTAAHLLRQFLKNTGNVVQLPYNGQRGRMFVRATWAYRDSIPVLVGVPTPVRERQEAAADREREQRRKEAKVTPDEAGETRPPAPVVERQGQVVSHIDYGKGTPDPKYSNVIVFTNGYLQCTICGKVFKKRVGIPTHMRMHAEVHSSKEVETLKGEIASLRLQVQANVKSLDPGAALTAITEYIQIIKDECARLQEENESLRAKPVGDPEAEAKLDLIREVLTKVQQGETSMMRGLSDINDAMEA